MKQVFISYQREDGDFADVLNREVKGAGYNTWIDNDQMRAGTDWREEIDHAIKASCALIVIMSPAAKDSEYVTYEWAFAWGAGIKVIPVVYKQTPLHPRLKTLHYLNFTNRTARPWEKLVDSLKDAALLSATTQQTQTPHSANTIQRTSEQWLETGAILHELEEYNKALEAYEKALHLDQNKAEIYKKKGDTLTCLKQYLDALISYKQATRLQPDFIEAYIAQCEPFTQLKRYKDALTLSEQAIRLDPNNILAYKKKGNALDNLKQYEEALTAYEQALHLDPNDALAYKKKGNALCRLKRYEEALTAYEQALRLDPNDEFADDGKQYVLGLLKKKENALAYKKKGDTLFKLKRYEEALTAFEQALRLDPDCDGAYNSKYHVLDLLEEKK
jgi:tetratricopeptide (TPR) repeat protein